ncbi:hypothetical protein MSC49_15360 [Methylosinus sp. C49]|uniref:hypothetical protein n=1 Tax=Methylosinus sp. C49 TaxID=2699395 RepID=UPI0013679511|nr:hypothetical protein [Methylosinus sp. C49]BBU61601.1 hypothetical protein MSC49_15360 [Methylosinus sp. C49]
MTRVDPPSSPGGDAEAPSQGGLGPISIADCRDLSPQLRRDLETLDYELRGVANRLLAEVDDAKGDAATFLRAATTVLLSVAAGLMETASDRAHEPTDVGAFKNAAEDAAQWAKSRKLRDLLADDD